MKKIITMLGVAATLLSTQAQSVHLQWARTFGGASQDDYQDIVTDTAGNAYYCGMYEGTIDLNPGAGVASYTASGSSKDAYVVKVDKYGNLGWIRTYSSTGNDYAIKIAYDPSGYIYVGGQAGNTVDFNEGSGTNKLANSGLFLLKLTLDGAFQSLIQPAGSNINDIAIDGFKNVYLLGNYYGTNLDFDHTSGTSTMSAKGGSDIFITKINYLGMFIWAKSFGGADNEYPSALYLDRYDNPHFVGTFSGTADLDPGNGTLNLVSKGLGDGFVCKVLNNGVFSWAAQIGNDNDDYATDIVVDYNSNVYITGLIDKKTDFNPGSGTFELTPSGSKAQYLVKLNFKGSFIWAGLYNGALINSRLYVEKDAKENIYVSGNVQDSIDLAPGAEEQRRKKVPGGWYSTYLSIIDTSINYISGFVIGTRINGKVSPYGNGKLFFIASYWNKTDCDLNADTTFVKPLNGGQDVLLAQYEIGELSHTKPISNFTVSAYPNPTEGNVHISMPQLRGTATIRVFNSTGQLVIENQIADIQHTEIQLPEKPGMYFVQVHGASGVHGSTTLIRN